MWFASRERDPVVAGRGITGGGVSGCSDATGAAMENFVTLKPFRGGIRKEGNVLFNDALNTFHLRLYGVGHMVKNHSDSERGNPLPPHGLLFPINIKVSFICTIPQTG